MNPVNLPVGEPSPEKLFLYSSLSEIFRSWFWRFYDHLGILIVYNLIWFFVLFVAGAVGWESGILRTTNGKISLFGLYVFYLVACLLSVGWCYAIFRLMNTGQASWFDPWTGTKKFSLRALGAAAISGIVIGLAGYNIYFYLHWSAEHRLTGLFLSGFLLWILFFWLETTLFHWPILFFQDPPFLKIFYRSFLLVVDNGWATTRILLFFAVFTAFFTIAPVGWIFLGLAFFFSLQCVTIEKFFLKYKITYESKGIDELLASLESERQRGWRDFWRPWENR